MDDVEVKPKKRTGFALLSPERRRECASRGGKISAQSHGFDKLSPERHREIARAGGLAVARRGTGHRFTPETARRAAMARVERMSESSKEDGT